MFIFHHAFFKRKNNGRFWITCNFFCNITVRNYKFIELKAVLKWFEFSVRSGHVTNDVTTVSISWSLLSCEVLLTSQALFLSALNYHSYWLLTSPPGNAPVQSHLNFQCQMSTGNFHIAHSNDYQGTLPAFELMGACSCSELKHIFRQSHVNNDVITLTLIRGTTFTKL